MNFNSDKTIFQKKKRFGRKYFDVKTFDIKTFDILFLKFRLYQPNVF